MANIDDAFSVESISFKDEVGFFYGHENPASSGYEAPKGSMYLSRPTTGNPVLYLKNGTTDTDWQAFSSDTSNFDHETVDTLTHNIAENCYVEMTRSSNRISSIITWTDNTKAIKIREESYSYSSGLVSQTITKHYDSEGSLLVTKTETINRSSGLVSSIDVVIT